MKPDFKSARERANWWINHTRHEDDTNLAAAFLELDALREGLEEPITELTLDTMEGGALMKSVTIKLLPGTYLIRRKPEALKG